MIRYLHQCTAAEHFGEEFALYLHKERGLAATTVEGYLGFVKRFLADVFGAGDADFSKLCATDVFSFVQRDAIRCPKRAKLMVTSLRSFFQYLRYQGYITIDLAASVPAVPRWRMANIPTSISPDQVELVLFSHQEPENCVSMQCFSYWLDLGCGREKSAL